MIFFIFVVTFATILTGLLPKALVLNRPENAALKFAALIELVNKVMGPILYLLEQIASFFLRLSDIKAKIKASVPDPHPIAYLALEILENFSSKSLVLLLNY